VKPYQNTHNNMKHTINNIVYIRMCSV